MTDTNLPEFMSEAELAHYGVKGMRWGVRRSAEERAAAKGARQEKRAGKKADRKARTQEIKDARARQAERSKEWGKAERQFYTSMVTGGRREAFRNLRDKAEDYNYNKDAAVAQRSTRGEKWAMAFLVAGTAAAGGFLGYANEKYS